MAGVWFFRRCVALLSCGLTEQQTLSAAALKDDVYLTAVCSVNHSLRSNNLFFTALLHVTELLAVLARPGMSHRAGGAMDTEDTQYIYAELSEI